MNPPLNRVFVYGTLHPEHPQFNRGLVLEDLRPLSWYYATAVGTRQKSLYAWDLVWFHEDGTKFPGAVLVLRSVRDLALLDRYEGFHEGHDDSLFIRKLITVTKQDGSTETAWGYEWGNTQEQERERLERYARYADHLGA